MCKTLPCPVYLVFSLKKKETKTAYFGNICGIFENPEFNFDISFPGKSKIVPPRLAAKVKNVIKCNIGIKYRIFKITGSIEGERSPIKNEKYNISNTYRVSRVTEFIFAVNLLPS